MPTLRALYQDPFYPVLFNSPPLEVSLEQKEYIKLILNKACSDTRFAEKAYASIVLVLTQGNAVPPVVTSLNPSSVKIGEPAFDIHVVGTGFTESSKILFNGLEEPTTFNSPTDVSTGVNMPLWGAPAVVPVTVVNQDGVSSPSMNFTFLPADPEVFAAKGQSGTVVVKK